MNDELEKIYYLNDVDEIVDQSLATKAIIRKVNQDGNLLEENFINLKESDLKEEKFSIDELTEDEQNFLNEFMNNAKKR